MTADGLDPTPPGHGLPMDAGIRDYVLILRAAQIETFASCEGGPGHACPEPTISFYGNPWEGLRAFAVAMTHGLPVLSIRYGYTVADGMLEGPTWEMVFRNRALLDARINAGSSDDDAAHDD